LNERLTAEPAAELIVMLHDDPASWDFDTWPMAASAERWGARGRSVTVEVDEPALECADAVTRRRLALWVERARASLCVLPVRDGELLAAVTVGGHITAWRSLDHNAYRIDSNWASTSDAPVVRGTLEWLSQAPSAIDSRSLLVEQVRETIFEVNAELNGPASAFGQRLKALLIGRNETLVWCLKNKLN